MQHCCVVHLQLRGIIITSGLWLSLLLASVPASLETTSRFHAYTVAAGGLHIRCCRAHMLLGKRQQVWVQGRHTWHSPVQVPAAADSRLPKV